MGRLVAALVAGLVLCSCGAIAPAGANTGIEGTMLIGPTCPVQRADSPCPDRPYMGEVSIRTTSGDQVADVHADAAGHFQVALAPGTYELVPISPHPGGLPFGRPTTVTVTSGQYVQVTVEFDSGIR